MSYRLYAKTKNVYTFMSAELSHVFCDGLLEGMFVPLPVPTIGEVFIHGWRQTLDAVGRLLGSMSSICFTRS